MGLPLAHQPGVSTEELDVKKLAYLLVFDMRKCGGHFDSPARSSFRNKECISPAAGRVLGIQMSATALLGCLDEESDFSQSGLLTPALALLKDFFIFRTPHTSIDTASQLSIFLCPICFLPFIPQVLIPRVLSKKNLCMLNFISESASWRSQTGTKNLLEITTSIRGKGHRGCIWLQEPFKLPWVWVAELWKTKHRQSESKGTAFSTCIRFVYSSLLLLQLSPTQKMVTTISSCSRLKSWSLFWPWSLILHFWSVRKSSQLHHQNNPKYDPFSSPRMPTPGPSHYYHCWLGLLKFPPSQTLSLHPYNLFLTQQPKWSFKTKVQSCVSLAQNPPVLSILFGAKSSVLLWLLSGFSREPEPIGYRWI